MDEPKPPVQAVFKGPHCPHCKKPLTRFSQHAAAFEEQGFLASIFWCPNEECSALLNIQILGPIPGRENRIMVPGAPQGGPLIHL